MDQQSYNGYTNHATWCVALWIDNDEGLHTEPARIADEILADLRDDNESMPADELRESAHAPFADALQAFAEDVFLSNDTTTGLLSDLLMSAWGDIDWDDLARTYLADAEIPDPIIEE